MNYINLGDRKWRGKWISKQDLVEYLRCKYRGYLSLSKGITISDMKETVLMQELLNRGLEYESKVVRDIQPQEAHTKESIEPLGREQE